MKLIDKLWRSATKIQPIRDFETRLAAPQDEARILKMLEASEKRGEQTREWYSDFRRDLAKALSRNPEHALFVLHKPGNSRILGVGHVCAYASTNSANLTRVLIDEPYRHQGGLYWLIKARLEYAKERGKKNALVLITNEEKTLWPYELLGFKGPDFPGTRPTLLMLEKRL